MEQIGWLIIWQPNLLPFPFLTHGWVVEQLILSLQDVQFAYLHTDVNNLSISARRMRLLELKIRSRNCFFISQLVWRTLITHSSRSLIHHEKKTFCGSKGSSQTPWLASWGRSPKTIKDIRQRETELYGSWGTYGVALKWCLCSYSTHWTGSFLRITIRRQLVLQLNYASDDTDVNIKIVMVPLCDCGRILCGPLAAYIVYKSGTITGWISGDSW